MLLRNISVDCVIFGFDGEKLNVLLWQADPRLLIQTLRENEDYEQVRVLYETHPSLQTESTWGLIGAHAPDESDLDAFAQEITTGSTGQTQSNPHRTIWHTAATYSHRTAERPAKRRSAVQNTSTSAPAASE